MGKLGKYYNFGKSGEIRISAGCVNRENPQVVFITLKAWMTLTEKIDDENFDFNVVRRLRREIFCVLNEYKNIFEKNFILDNDFNTEEIVIGKPKFLTCDLFLKQRKNLHINAIKPTLENIAKNVAMLIDDIYSNNAFVINANKTSKNELFSWQKV